MTEDLPKIQLEDWPPCAALGVAAHGQDPADGEYKQILTDDTGRVRAVLDADQLKAIAEAVADILKPGWRGEAIAETELKADGRGLLYLEKQHYGLRVTDEPPQEWKP